MKALKYRLLWASGPGPYNWEMMPPHVGRKWIKEFIDRIADEQHSDKFRGVECTCTGKIPQEVVNHWIDSASETVQGALQRLVDLREYSAGRWPNTTRQIAVAPSAVVPVSELQELFDAQKPVWIAARRGRQITTRTSARFLGALSRLAMRVKKA